MLSRIRNIWNASRQTVQQEGLQIPKEKLEGLSDSKILSFAAGRSGQRWINTIFHSHANCSGGCERSTNLESFFRYVTWYGLPIDLEAFYHWVEKEIEKDLDVANTSIYSSPYFAFGFDQLVERIKPDWVFFHIRKPVDVINSNYIKKWYHGEALVGDKSLTPGLQPFMSENFHHSFSRILPKGDYFDEWLKLTPIGKISWYYVQINSFLIDKMNKTQVPKWFFKLSEIDQNYDYYRHLAKEFNLTPIFTKEQFLSLKGNMKNKAKKRRSYEDWNTTEKEEFSRIVEPFMETYESIKTTGI